MPTKRSLSVTEYIEDYRLVFNQLDRILNEIEVQLKEVENAYFTNRRLEITSRKRLVEKQLTDLIDKLSVQKISKRGL